MAAPDLIEQLVLMRDIGALTRRERDLLADAANEIDRLRNEIKRSQASQTVDERRAREMASLINDRLMAWDELSGVDKAIMVAALRRFSGSV